MKKIRILHVLGGLNQGGVENLLMNIYRKIDKNKIQFDFLVNREGFFDEEVKKMGGKIYYIPSLQSVGEIKYRKNLDNFYKEHKGEYKIVHSHLNQVSGLILEIAFKNNIPIRISHSHNNAYSINFVAKIYKEFLRKKIDKYANCLFACSDEAAQFMFHKKAKEALIINNGISINKFVFDIKKREKFRRKHGIPEKAIVLGHIGRFEKQKNHEFLIEIFDEYYKLNNNSYFILLGTGTTKNHITELCQNKIWKEKILFLEPTSDVDEIYCAMDAFVLPSLYEGLGIVLVEAQTAGLWCYATEATIPKTVQITDKFKFISLKESPAVWANQIIRTQDKHRSELKYKTNKNPYDIMEVVKKIEETYLEMYKRVK